MSKAYFNETDKIASASWPAWTHEQQNLITDILNDKGYNICCVSRIGCDRKCHDAWLVERDDIPRLIEQLFRQRITVEVQAEGRGKASINFCYDYSAAHILSAVKRFHRNNNRRVLV